MTQKDLKSSYWQPRCPPKADKAELADLVASGDRARPAFGGTSPPLAGKLKIAWYIYMQ